MFSNIEKTVYNRPVELTDVVVNIMCAEFETQKLLNGPFLEQNVSKSVSSLRPSNRYSSGLKRYLFILVCLLNDGF